MDYKEWALAYMSKTKIPINETIDDIIDAIKNNKPLSYTRFGDGELHFLKEYFSVIKNNPKFITLCGADSYIDKIPTWDIPNTNAFTYYCNRYHTNVINKSIFEDRYGVSDDSIKLHIIKIIGESVIYALQNSSHIGIWDIDNVIHTNTFRNFCLFMHSYPVHKELLDECNVDTSRLTSVLANRNKIFSNPLEFKNILNGQPIHIMTSNEDHLKNVTKIHEILDTEVSYTNVTPVKGNWLTHSFANQAYLYDRCKDIKEHIILYGLGGGAKNIPSHLYKNYGKCVIDMGAVLDGWSGKITRPYMKDETHMIIKASENTVENYPWDKTNNSY